MDEETVEEKELTPEETVKNLKQIFEFFADKDCTAPGCYGRGWVGTDVKTGKLIPCGRRKCALMNLKRHQLREKLEKRKQDKIDRESEENSEETTKENNEMVEV